MNTIRILLITGIALAAMESVAGIAMMTYGMNYVELDEEAASEMLAFISENNPEYYVRIESNEDQSYRNGFYAHYVINGDRRTTVAGMMMLLIAVGNSVPLIAIFLMQSCMEKKREKKKNRIELNENEEEKTDKAEEVNKQEDKGKEKEEAVKTG